MGHISGEHRALSPDIKLDYLAILERDQEDLISHSNQIFNRVM